MKKPLLPDQQAGPCPVDIGTSSERYLLGAEEVIDEISPLNLELNSKNS
ncbi:hypothetical protein [Ensifer aridi]|nr:hypothetical protein [Ensifer aridi]